MFVPVQASIFGGKAGYHARREHLQGDTLVGSDFIWKNWLEKIVSYKHSSLFGLSVTDASVE